MDLTTNETTDLFAAVLVQPEFEPYAKYLHFTYSPAGATVGCISVVLQYEVNRYLSELIELQLDVWAAETDAAPAVILDKVCTALRRLIARAHSGNYIAGSEMFGELQSALRSADKAFE